MIVTCRHCLLWIYLVLALLYVEAAYARVDSSFDPVHGMDTISRMLKIPYLAQQAIIEAEDYTQKLRIDCSGDVFLGPTAPFLNQSSVYSCDENNITISFEVNRLLSSTTFFLIGLDNFVTGTTDQLPISANIGGSLIYA